MFNLTILLFIKLTVRGVSGGPGARALSHVEEGKGHVPGHVRTQNQLMAGNRASALPVIWMTVTPRAVPPPPPGPTYR